VFGDGHSHGGHDHGVDKKDKNQGSKKDKKKVSDGGKSSAE
jgi:hypothetical protein